jgi:hypothetical protein
MKKSFPVEIYAADGPGRPDHVGGAEGLKQKSPIEIMPEQRYNII